MKTGQPYILRKWTTPGLVPDDDFIGRDNKGLKSFKRETEFISGHVEFEDSIIYYDFKPQRRVLDMQFRFGSQQHHKHNIRADK